ncbi:MAG: fimbrillin family protein, partial [Tannerellaceae bacterium]|nr:fimbrillin family protein [Tannerellaceae bacterium]
MKCSNSLLKSHREGFPSGLGKRPNSLIALLVFFLCLLATSCRGDDNPPEPPAPTAREGYPIGFSAISKNKDATRVNGELVTQENLEEFAVFAFQTTGDWDAASAKPDFMFNQTVKKENGQWTYSPMKYWPSLSSGNRLSFFAVAPMFGNESGISQGKNKEMPGAISFQVNLSIQPQKHVDLCVARPVMNRTYSMNNGLVSLQFEHVMAQISFAAKYKLKMFEDPGTYFSNGNALHTADVHIRRITLSGIRLDTWLYLEPEGYRWDETEVDYGSVTVDDEVWATNQRDLVEELLPLLEEDTDTNPNIITTKQGTLCLLPHASNGKPDEQKSSIMIVTEIFGNEWTITGDFPEYTWEAGNHYTYNFLINISSREYTFIEDMEEFIAPEDGTYLLEVWGAQGGDGSVEGIPGNYISGTYEMKKDETLYVSVGEKGKDRNYEYFIAGANPIGMGHGGPGGRPYNYGIGYDYLIGASGGAASLIHTDDYNEDSYLIIAGGGGGRGEVVIPGFNPGYGGSLSN